MKILVVDDSKFSRKRVTSVVSELECDLIQASDGEEGFSLFEREQPDLVISDLLMPNVDGIGLLKLIRAADSQVPVIIVSADIQESSRAICKDFGIVTFLNKPFKPAQLREAIDRVFAQTGEVTND